MPVTNRPTPTVEYRNFSNIDLTSLKHDLLQSALSLDISNQQLTFATSIITHYLYCWIEVHHPIYANI